MKTRRIPTFARPFTGKLLALSLGLMPTFVPTAAPTAEAAPKRSEAAQARYALTGVELHVGDGSIVQDATIIVEGDRIAAVGGPELLSKYPGIQKEALPGKWVTPGFIAVDARIGLVEIGAESSTVDRSLRVDHPIHAAYDPASAVNADSSLIRVQALEGITSAAVAPTGGVLSGQVTFIDLLHGDYANIVARPRVAIDGSLGQAYAGSRAATAELLRRTLRDAAYYRRNRRNFERGASRKLAASPEDLEALFPLLDGKIPLTLDANRASDILTALDIAEEFDLELVIIGGAEAWKVAGALAEAKASVVVMPTENLPGSFDRLGARMDNAALLHAAGVRVVISELGEAHNLRNAKQQAGVAVANGLDHEAAISALTANAAAAYGVDDDYGTVAAGKVANFVVWDHDPFELDSWAERVFIRGAEVPPVSRQTLLRDRYLQRHREAGVIPPATR